MNLNFTCLTSCPDRFFPNNQAWKCLGCPYDCLTCEASRNCLSCSNSTDFRTLVNNRCVPLPGYYDNSAQTCFKCFAVCKTCTSLAFCTSCVTGYFLRSDNKCYSSCLPAFYADSLSLSCLPCPQACAICLSPISCTICRSGNYLRLDNMC